MMTRLICKFLIILIEIYQNTLSAIMGCNCRFIPTCSEYAKQSLLRHGLVYGVFLAIIRLLMCNPFTKSRVDNVPSKISNYYIFLAIFKLKEKCVACNRLKYILK